MKHVILAIVCFVAAGCSGPAESFNARALRIHRESPLVDGHNDLPWELRKKGNSNLWKMDFRQRLPDTQTDLPRLKAGGVGAAFFAAYVPTSAAQRGYAARMTLEQIDLIHRMVQHAPGELEFARTADDVVRIHRAGRIAALIGIEGGHTIENSLALLRQYYDLGARYMTLTHTDNTDWADAAGVEPRHGGLAAFGEEVVREMNRLGMMVDLSHVSDDAMRDALRVSEAPVIFSHSSARALARPAARRARRRPAADARQRRRRDGQLLQRLPPPRAARPRARAGRPPTVARAVPRR